MDFFSQGEKIFFYSFSENPLRYLKMFRYIPSLIPEDVSLLYENNFPK